MSRMSVIALAAAVAFGGATIATEASAKGGSSGHSGGMSMHSTGTHSMGMRSMGMNSMGGHHHHGGFFFGSGFGYYPYYAGDYGYGDCWRLRRVHTQWGWRWRRVDVCGYPY